MTKRYVASKANYLPVVYRLYHLHMYGENKGQPNPATFHTLILERCVDPKYPGEKYESVGDTNGRLKQMLTSSECRWTILACEESAKERDARRKADGIELLRVGDSKGEEPVVAAIHDAEEAPTIVPITKSKKVKAVDDDEVGGRKDTGRISVKRGKKPAQPAVAA